MATNISDEELTAYLDGEADGALAGRIEAALMDDDTLAVRLDGLRFDVDALRGEAGAFLADAPSFTLPPAPASRGFGIMGGAMAACLALGLGLGFFLSDQPEEQTGWVHYVAAYQALYVGDTLAGVEADPTQISELSSVLGRDLAAATASPELTFKRGQRLGFNGKPLIQLAYLSEEGAPMALCIIAKSGEAKPVSQRVLEGMQAASWSDGEFAYLLIGGEDADLVKRAALHFEAQL